MVPAIHTRTTIRSIEHRTTGVYRSSDLRAVQDAALDAASSELDEAIDCVPLSFKLDDKDHDPQCYGNSARSIKARFLVFVYPRTLLSDFVQVFNAAGIEVSSFRAAGRGLASSLLSLRRTAENAVLVDIGQGSTTGAIMIGGTLHNVFSIPVGGAHMTNDMAVGTGLNFAECERIKIAVGLATDSSSTHSHEHMRFLRPRVAEICSLMGKNFALYARSLDGGILLCGGASYLRGFAGELSKVLSVPTPFVCQLTRATTEALFPNVTIKDLPENLTSAYLSLIAAAASLRQDISTKNLELQNKPLAKLRPLWTWLSELSR
jgi:cell division ATPase FtsA